MPALASATPAPLPPEHLLWPPAVPHELQPAIWDLRRCCSLARAPSPLSSYPQGLLGFPSVLPLWGLPRLPKGCSPGCLPSANTPAHGVAVPRLSFPTADSLQPEEPSPRAPQQASTLRNQTKPSQLGQVLPSIYIRWQKQSRLQHCISVLLALCLWGPL